MTSVMDARAPEHRQWAGRSWRFLVVIVALGIAYMTFYLVARPTAQLWGSQMHAQYGRRVFTESNMMRTDAWTETITGITTPANGIAITKTTVIPSNGPAIAFRPGATITLPAHSLVTIRTVYRVTDCKHATATGSPLPIVVSLRRLWLNNTVSYHDQGTDYPDAGKACGFYN